MAPGVADLPSRWLLVGNSRWHWAAAGPDGLRIHHQPPEAALAASAPPAALRAWAAVGPLPGAWPADPLRRLATEAVPLRGLPAWLGVDRALAGWMGWRLSRAAVLVADAGTVLSLTRITATGRFAGGRLIAGLGLQLRAMADSTAALPPPPAPEQIAAPGTWELWPQATAAAMHTGVSRSLVATLVAAHQEARREDPHCQLLLSGGDAPHLLPLLQEALPAAVAEQLRWEPDLALRGLVALRPA